MQDKSTENYVSTYEATRRVAIFISSLGWLVFTIAVVVALYMFIESFSSKHGLVLLWVLAPSLSAALGGLMFVITGQITRAAVDSADHTGEMLAIMKTKGSLI